MTAPRRPSAPAPSASLLAGLALIGILAGVGADQGLGGAPAAARTRKAAAETRAVPPVVDISSYRDKMIVLTDDEGVFFAVLPVPMDQRVLFIGDGVHMYEQRLGSGSSDPTSDAWSIGTRASRVKWGLAHLYRTEKRFYLDCGDDEGGRGASELRQLPAEASTKLLTTATFHEPYWTRQARSLARDDAGTYYYVDQLDDAHGGEGFRVFIGKRGSMVEQKMKSLVTDSAGDIFSTKKGELRVVMNADSTATWIRGKKRTSLVVLPVEANLPLIYRDLGIYGFLGMACEDR